VLKKNFRKYRIQIKTLLKILVLLVILVLVFYSAFVVASTVGLLLNHTKMSLLLTGHDGSPEFTLEPADKTTRGTEIICIAEDS
jgi:molecular chaperone HtpG